MSREDIQACLKIGAAAATILVLLGGPIGAALYILDGGVREATTRCESASVSEIARLQLQRAEQYLLYVNAKTNILSSELGYDLRPESVVREESDQAPLDVYKHQRDEAWKQLPVLDEEIRAAIKKAEDCPEYGGILE